jgi:UDPglucose 6-dehydrogenase
MFIACGFYLASDTLTGRAPADLDAGALEVRPLKIGVVGTGYVGLVVGAGLAENGNTVVCVDKDAAKIEALKRGVVPIYEPGLAELITRNAAEERLRFTTDLPEAVKASDIIFVAVGTPQDEDGSADMTHVLAVADAIGRAMDGYKVVVNKSTVPVGTAARVRKVIAGLTTHPFAVVSNPEFLKEGAAVGDFLKPDRVVVGADDPQAEALMKELYEPFVRTGNPILTMDPASAELTKYAANAMLATRISFMNEIANLCDQVGADVRQVRLGMGSDERIGSGFLFPGIGYGGSCFPKDVKALMRLAEDAGTSLQVVDAVDRVNNAQKELLVPRIVRHLGSLQGKVVAIWGLAFKPRTDDMREAPAVTIIEGLLAHGATVRVYDPKAMEAARSMLGDRVTWCAKSYECVEGADALVLATEWNEFREPDFPRIKSLMRHPAVFDGRNVWSPQTLRDLGFHYEGIGRR